MTLTRTTLLMALCAFLAAPVLAQPSVSVDLVRKPDGTPQLNANGNFEYEVRVTPDTGLFAPGAAGSENDGITGGSVGVEAGYTLSTSTNDPNDGGGLGLNSDWASSFIIGATKGDAFTGGQTDNFGTTVFGWDAGLDGLEVSTGDDQAVTFNGSLFLTQNGVVPNVGWELDADGTTLLATIEAPGPVAGAAGNRLLSTKIDISGAYAGGNGQIAQAGTGYENVTGSVEFRTRAGDVTLNGIIDGADLNAIGANWLQLRNWDGGDITGDGVTDGADLNAIGANWNQSAPAPIVGLSASVVPEPSTAMMICGFTAAAGLLLRRKMR